jgi:hypothetical protein
MAYLVDSFGKLLLVGKLDADMLGPTSLAITIT